MDPIQVGDIITLELKNGSTISDLMAIPDDKGSTGCTGCAMLHNRGKHSCKCFDGWVIRNPEKYGPGPRLGVALCCTKPVFAADSKDIPKFCKLIKIDDILENL